MKYNADEINSMLDVLMLTFVNKLAAETLNSPDDSCISSTTKTCLGNTSKISGENCTKMNVSAEICDFQNDSAQEDNSNESLAPQKGNELVDVDTIDIGHLLDENESVQSGEEEGDHFNCAPSSSIHPKTQPLSPQINIPDIHKKYEVEDNISENSLNEAQFNDNIDQAESSLNPKCSTFIDMPAQLKVDCLVEDSSENDVFKSIIDTDVDKPLKTNHEDSEPLDVDLNESVIPFSAEHVTCDTEDANCEQNDLMENVSVSNKDTTENDQKKNKSDVDSFLKSVSNYLNEDEKQLISSKPAESVESPSQNSSNTSPDSDALNLEDDDVVEESIFEKISDDEDHPSENLMIKKKKKVGKLFDENGDSSASEPEADISPRSVSPADVDLIDVDSGSNSSADTKDEKQSTKKRRRVVSFSFVY